MIPVYVFVVLGSVGLAFGLLLAIANKFFSVETDPRIEEVEDALPKGQCGACGFAGCRGYAEAVVKNPDVPANLCIPGKDETARKVAELTGKSAAPAEARVASVRCAGTHSKAKRVYDYKGIQGCVSANMLQGGYKACKYGCLGFGTCAKSCPFHAIQMSADGLPVVNPEKCTGCGKCRSACPRGVIVLISPSAKVRVNCSSKDKGALSRQYCQVSCIGCKACERACPHGSAKVVDNLASVDAGICSCCDNPLCLAPCPTKAIRPVVLGVVPGTEDAEQPLPTRFEHAVQE